MKLHYILIIFFLHTFALSAQNQVDPTDIQDNRTWWEYKEKLNDEMNIPAHLPHYLAFRVGNEYGTLDEQEFYLQAILQRDWMYIKYPKSKSIFNQLNETFLSNPEAKIGDLYFKPQLIHKRISYDACPAAKPLIYEVEEYLTSEIIPEHESFDERSKKTYTIGYGKFFVDRVYQTQYEAYPPVQKLLKIKEIALECARDLPTVEEEKILEEEKRRREYKGKIYTSPPNIILSHNGVEQISVIGSFCWPIDTRVICADGMSWPSPNVAVNVTKGERIDFVYPEREQVNHVEYQLRKVSDSDKQEDINSSDKLYWNVPVENVVTMKPSEMDSLIVNVESGLYLLTLFGWWQGIGDATHGFLIEVE